MTRPRSNDSLSRHLAEALKRAVAAEEGRRGDMVRAVLSQQWATAITLMLSEAVVTWDPLSGCSLPDAYASRSCRSLAALPCASDVVEAILSARVKP